MSNISKVRQKEVMFFTYNSMKLLKPRLHDTTGCQTGCQTVECLYTRYNRLSYRCDNRFDNRIDNRLYRVYKHLPGCQTGLTTGLTTGCIV